jgi:hypothetical protein
MIRYTKILLEKQGNWLSRLLFSSKFKSLKEISREISHSALHENIEIVIKESVPIEKLIKVVSFLKKIGFERIKISFSSFPKYSNPDFLRINQAGAWLFDFTIYGDEKTHLRITKNKESFEKIINSIHAIRSVKLKNHFMFKAFISLTMPLFSSNYTKFHRLVDLCIKMDIDRVNIILKESAVEAEELKANLAYFIDACTKNKIWVYAEKMPASIMEDLNWHVKEAYDKL